jgi:outer membrane protein OmpA-like peptidoglycan-associated protein
MRPLTLSLVAIPVLVWTACTKPAPQPEPRKAIHVTVSSRPEKASLVMDGRVLGETPRTLSVATADELLKLVAIRGNEKVVEKRIHFLSLDDAEVSFLFGAEAPPMAKALGLPRVLVFDYGAGVTFDLSKASLKPEFLPLLSRQADLLKVHFSGMDVFVCGHTDTTGTRDRNLSLSLDRAKAVSGDLVEKGVPRPRIKVQGLGSEFPVAGNDTESGRALNRRTEVVLPM